MLFSSAITIFGPRSWAKMATATEFGIGLENTKRSKPMKHKSNHRSQTLHRVHWATASPANSWGSPDFWSADFFKLMARYARSRTCTSMRQQPSRRYKSCWPLKPSSLRSCHSRDLNPVWFQLSPKLLLIYTPAIYDWWLGVVGLLG